MTSTNAPNKINIGTVLLNTATGENLGAIVNIIPSTKNIILFRVEKKVHPTFSKINIADIIGEPIIAGGNINNSHYGDLKLQLLKYYRTRNLSEIESQMLSKLIQYAYPNGIPLYNPGTALQEETVRHLGIRDKIKPGAAFNINVTDGSIFPHLDNKTVWVLNHDNHGVWVCDDLKCVNNPGFSYIPYKDPEVPTFYGISKLLPASSSNIPNFEQDFSAIKGVFDTYSKDNILLSQIVHDNTRLKVDPAKNNLILLPNKYTGQCYDYKLGRVCNSGDISSINAENDARTSIFTANEPLILNDAKPDISNPVSAEPFIIEDDPVLMAWMDKLDHFKQNNQDDQLTINQVGGGGKSESSSNNDILPDNDDLLALLERNGSITGQQHPLSEDESAPEGLSDLEEVGEDTIKEVGTYQKTRVIPVPELLRTYKESIQRGHIQRQKLEKIPPILRDRFKDKIMKEVNIISLIKNQVTLDNNTVKLPVPDYKPLVERYLDRNFAHNQFLIPLVISTRKIFLTKKDKLDKGDFNPNNSQVTEDFYKYISDIEKEKRATTNKLINLDEELGKQVINQAPYISHQSKLGMLIRLGEKINEEPEQLRINTARNVLDKASQDTLVIQFGQKPFEIDNYGLDKSTYDSFVALGPLSRFINKEDVDLSSVQLDEMEEQVDRNIDIIASEHKFYYYGDNLNLVGFVRPPLNQVFDLTGSHGTNIGADSIKADLQDEDKVIVRQLHKLRMGAADNTTNLTGGGADTEDVITALDNPDKYIIYVFPGLIGQGPKTKDTSAGTNIMNETRLKRYLDKAIPSIDEITALYMNTWKIDNSSDLYRLIDILAKFDYFYNNTDAQLETQSRNINKTVSTTSTYNRDKLSYEEYGASLAKVEARILDIMTDYSNKMDKIIKLKSYRKRKQEERRALDVTTSSSNEIKARVITDDLIDLADKIYGEKFIDLSGGKDNLISKTDEYRLDYYAKQEPDHSRLMNLLLRQKAYKDFETHNNREKLENTLFVLKNKYESLSANNKSQLLASNLPAEITNKLSTCSTRIDRKPKIIKYPSLERLKADNGKVITNTRGEVVMSGDYAVVDETGEKLVFKREQLVEGDYWIAQPISVLESLLLKKKKADCESGLTDEQKAEMRAKMHLPGEQLTDTSSDPNRKVTLTPEEIAQCTFNPEKLTCLPEELTANEEELRELEARIRDIKSHLDFVTNLPVHLAENNKAMSVTEDSIRSYLTGLAALNKHSEEKHIEEQRILEGLIKRRRDCVHFGVVDYLAGLANLTDMEKFGLAKQIIDRFQNTEQVDGLVLDVLDTSASSKNNLECYICNQTLLCKHYAYAIKLIENSTDGMLDEHALIHVYGEENGLSYYCKNCGVQLANTAVQDLEEFEKGGLNDGMHIKTREVLEDINIIERQQKAIKAIMDEAIQGGDDKEDLEMKLRIFALLKKLCGITAFSMEDDLEMINFLKTYSSGITRKALYNYIALTFMKAGKQIQASIIDGLAHAEYWKYVTGDIMARFLVILQTSRTMYPVYNKVLSSEYMGWPLIGSDKNTDSAGIDLLLGCAKQMIILPDYAYLNSGTAGIAGFKTILISRMEELIKNDELVRTRLDRALDEKYKLITMQEEKESHITNYWRAYRPLMTMDTDVGWSPAHDVSPAILKDWTAKTLPQILLTAHENIIYQAQLLRHNMTGEIKKHIPTTRLTLNTNLANGCCPIDFSKLDTTSSKDKTLRINYYTQLVRANESILANVNKIKAYAGIIRDLKSVVDKNKLIIKMPALYQPYTELKLNITLTEDQLKDYFLKYIDNGIYKGDEHLFNSFGRCLISNQLQNDVALMKYGQQDFERLLRDVYAKTRQHDITLLSDPENLLNPDKYEASTLVIRLLNQLQYISKELSAYLPTELAKSITKITINIQSAVAPKLIEEIHYEPECMTRILAVTEDYEMVAGLLTVIKDHKTNHIWLKKKVNHLELYLYDILAIINKTLYDIILEYLKTGILSREAFKFVDAKKEYFGLITKIDTDSQALIGGILDDMRLNKKDELAMELFLVNLGELKAIKRDYKTYLEKQEQILARVNYTNLDLETDQLALLNRAGMIKKYMRDTRTIISNLKNGSWSGLKSSDEIPETHLAEFFKYKDNNKLFIKVGDIINVFWSIISGLNSGGGDNSRVFGADIYVSIAQYLFIVMLDCILSMNGVENIRESSLVLSSLDESSYVQRMKNRQAQQIVNDMFEPGAITLETTKQPGADKLDEQDTEKDKATDKLPGMENLEMALDGDFGNEPGDEYEEEDEEEDNMPDFATKLIKAQRTQQEILVEFIKDLLTNIKGTEFLYNEMNLGRIAEEKARTLEKQKRQNLRAFKFLNMEGMEDDYRMIQNLRAIGKVDYKDLNEVMQQYFGANYYDDEGGPDPDITRDHIPHEYNEDVDDYGDIIQNTEQARANKLGLDDYEMDELGYVGAAEDMEEQDYGYLGVDED